MAFLKFVNGGGPNLDRLTKVVLGEMPGKAVTQPNILVGDATSESIKPDIVVDVYFCESCWIVHGGSFCPVRGPLSSEGLSGVSVHDDLSVAASSVHDDFPVAPTVGQGSLLGDVLPVDGLVVHARASSLSPSIHNSQIDMTALKVPAGKLANFVKQDQQEGRLMQALHRQSRERHLYQVAKHGIASRRSPKKRAAGDDDDSVVKSEKKARKADSEMDVVSEADPSIDERMENWFSANFIQQLNSKLYKGLGDLSSDRELSSEQRKTIRAIANVVVGPFKRFIIEYRKDFTVAERDFWCKQLDFEDVGPLLKDVVLGKAKYSIPVDPRAVMVIESSDEDGVPPKAGPSGSKSGGAKIKEAKEEVVGKGKAKVVEEEGSSESDDDVLIGETSKGKAAGKRPLFFPPSD
ncbi:hypothetical protein T439DRAFT_337803 [Meredithblackwellia eburnea MCA 4105]